MTWIKRHLLGFAALVVLAYMLLPNVVVAVFSFNDPVGRYNYNWESFSVDAWANPCGAQGICEAVGLSLQVGLIASLVARPRILSSILRPMTSGGSPCVSQASHLAAISALAAGDSPPA